MTVSLCFGNVGCMGTAAKALFLNTVPFLFVLYYCCVWHLEHATTEVHITQHCGLVASTPSDSGGLWLIEETCFSLDISLYASSQTSGSFHRPFSSSSNNRSTTDLICLSY